MKKGLKAFFKKVKELFKKRPILMRTISVILAILVLNQSITIMTDVNFIEIGVRKLLEAVDIYSEERLETDFYSDGWKDNEPGSWHVRKSAKWTGINKAQVSLSFDTKEKADISGEHYIRDVILVVDTSLSMENDGKLNKVKEQASRLVDDFLDDEKNYLALVQFNDTAEELSYFTQDKESLKNKIDALTPTGNTNYNDALLKVGDILEKYSVDETPRDYKSVLVIFLTDGVPCVDHPNEVGTYNLLKEKYTYIHIKGIQYEMGDSVTGYLKSITDSQEIATKENLGEKFLGATIVTEKYEKFEITDYIKDKYFYIESADDISVGSGHVELQDTEDGGQKVVWSFDDGSLQTGFGYDSTESYSLSMNITLTLRDDYAQNNDKDYYPTNEILSVVSKLPNEEEKTKSEVVTPVLKRIYTVYYDTNPPTGCNIKKITKENHYAMAQVEKSQEKLVCPGYLFKGWEIANEDVTSINDDVFVMPTYDVTVRGTWAKIGITKTVGGGSIRRKINLYDQVKFDAQSGFGADIYNGPVTETYGNTLDDVELYYYKLGDRNNIIFGGFCWQMVRTTATGGIKIIYNGVPSAEGQCFNTGEDQTVGRSIFNPSGTSLSYSGYMYNIVYNDVVISYNDVSDTTLFSNDVVWDGEKYILVDPQVGIDASRHYTCNDDSESCEVVSYYQFDAPNGLYYIYIDLKNGDKIDNALFNAIGYSKNGEINENLNVTDSKIKQVVDKWYEENIDGKDFASYIEDVVYCNNRSVTDLAGWNPNNRLTGWLYFSSSQKYECPNVTDQFSVQNPYAELTYPVGLITYAEKSTMDQSFYDIGINYFTMNPNYKQYYLVMRGIAESSWYGDIAIYTDNIGVRPVIALKSGAQYKDGNGTPSDPYIVFYE